MRDQDTKKTGISCNVSQRLLYLAVVKSEAFSKEQLVLFKYALGLLIAPAKRNHVMVSIDAEQGSNS
jgi:hypothetical protein